MQIQYVPTLQMQRDLYAMPRDEARFQHYLDVMRGSTDDIALPLPAFNPMGHEHVAQALDGLLAIDADTVVRDALETAASELPEHLDSLRATLVLSDDIGGMWTHRRSTEFARRFEDDALLKRSWVVPLGWTSDGPSAAALTIEARTTLYRAAYRMTYGPPTHLGDLLLQEGFALLFAGVQPSMRALPHALDRYIEAANTPTVFGALFGDRAAAELGYPAVGLPPDAGFAVGVAMAQESGQSAVEWLRSS